MTGTSTARTGCTATCASTMSPIPRTPAQRPVWLGGCWASTASNGRKLTGGRRCCSLAWTGSRLYVTNSLYSTWDNQFYPGLECWMVKSTLARTAACPDPDFYVDFGTARAHEMRLPNGDPTTRSGRSPRIAPSKSGRASPIVGTAQPETR